MQGLAVGERRAAARSVGGVQVSSPWAGTLSWTHHLVPEL